MSHSLLCQIFAEACEVLGAWCTVVGGAGQAASLLGPISFTSEDPAAAPGPPTGGTPGTLAEEDGNPSLCPRSVHRVLRRTRPRESRARPAPGLPLVPGGEFPGPRGLGPPAALYSQCSPGPCLAHTWLLSTNRVLGIDRDVGNIRQTEQRKCLLSRGRSSWGERNRKTNRCNDTG